jgi:methionine-rich copper-binding protein CopC
LALALFSGWLGLLPQAVAHPELLASYPDDGSALAKAPQEIRLTFFDAVEPQLATVTLSVNGSPPRQLTSRLEGPEVLVTVDGVPAGENQHWYVTYEVVAYDGHPVAGTLSFMVAPGPSFSAVQPSVEESSSSTSPSAPAPARSPASDADPGSTGSRTFNPLLVIVPIAVIGLAMAGPAMVTARNRRRSQPPGTSTVQEPPL